MGGDHDVGSWNTERCRLHSGVFRRNYRRHDVERIDLSMWVRDGRAYVWSAIFEHQYIRNVVASAECCGPLCPQINDTSSVIGGEIRE
jgi:hypothetical protein